MTVNPEQQWRMLADKQFQQSKLRQLQQKQLQKQLKQKYLQQLSQQIRLKQRSIDFQRRLQKSVDRHQIQKSLQDHRRSIQIQKLKTSLIVDKASKLDTQNLILQKQKKRRQIQIQQLQKQIERAKHEEAEIILGYQKEKEEKKKEYYRMFLKQTMEMQKQVRKEVGERERQVERQKLRELEVMEGRRDQERHKQLQKLKQRAKQVDYGSHTTFAQHQYKTLIQKKSQQWQTYRDSIQRQQTLKKMQHQQRIGRKLMQNYYHRELKNQINQKDQQKRRQIMEEKQRDRSMMTEAERLRWMIEEDRRRVEYERKRVLYGCLKEQQGRKDLEKKWENQMKQHEVKINLNALDPHLTNRRSSYSTVDADSSRYTQYTRPTPGDTFRIDPQRMKQLETISKAIKFNNAQSTNTEKLPIDVRSQRYFASKGLSLLG